MEGHSIEKDRRNGHVWAMGQGSGMGDRWLHHQAGWWLAAAVYIAEEVGKTWASVAV